MQTMTEAPRILKSTQRKKLAVFLDGTWNNVGDDTNVWRLKSLCSPTGTDGSPQLAYYKKASAASLAAGSARVWTTTSPMRICG